MAHQGDNLAKSFGSSAEGSLLGSIQGPAHEDGEGCTKCLHPKEEEGKPRGRRLNKCSRPHASFNNGISSVYSSEEVSDKRLCMSLLSES